jgi:hypothetical protein
LRKKRYKKKNGGLFYLYEIRAETTFLPIKKNRNFDKKKTHKKKTGGLFYLLGYFNFNQWKIFGTVESKMNSNQNPMNCIVERRDNCFFKYFHMLNLYENPNLTKQEKLMKLFSIKCKKSR